MSSLGTYKINKILIRDYADGKIPNRVFRAEIDIPLGSEANYQKLQTLLETRPSKETNAKILSLILRKLGAPLDASPQAKEQHRVARQFLAATFGIKLPPAAKGE